MEKLDIHTGLSALRNLVYTDNHVYWVDTLLRIGWTEERSSGPEDLERSLLGEFE